MPDYTDIEQKSKTVVRQEEEKQETKARNKPAVTGKVKKGLLERLVVGMLGPDGIPAISEYLNREIVVPALKEVFVNSVTSAVNMMVYKSGDHTPPRNYGGNPRQHCKHSQPITQKHTNPSPTMRVRHQLNRQPNQDAATLSTHIPLTNVMKLCSFWIA